MEKVKSAQKQDELSTEDKAFNRFAEMMIEKIESIKDNWQKPWFTESAWCWPKNISGREYNGMNALMLMFLCEKNGYKIPRFCTFNQVQHMNDDGSGKDLPKVFIQRGEKSFPVIFPSVTCIHKKTKEKIRYEDYKQLSPEEQAQYNVYPKTQVFNVFNVAQTNLQEARPDLWQKLEAEYSAPKVDNHVDFSFAPIDKMIQENLWICPIIPKHQDNAYFSPSRNEIIVPEKTQFKTGESYYTTVFHEMTHSTGAAGVLDRLKPSLRGSDEYAREELVAEMGAALVALRYGMSRHIKEDSCAYIKGWLSNLKESPQFIKTTLGDVRKATLMITQKIDGIALEIEQGKSEEKQVATDEKATLSETPDIEPQAKVEKNGAYHQLTLPLGEPVNEVQYDALLSPSPLHDGVEFANVQRMFEENKAFQFSAPNRITSPRDVAYIFKQLETSSIENAFAVLVKDHKPTVLHLAMGTFSFVLAPIEPVIAADNRIHADEIYFVHNHPSGQLKASRNDMNLLKMMKSKFGDRMQPGIIINTRSGRYGTFTDNETLESSSLENGNEQVYTIPTYSFSRLVFSKTYNEAGFIRNSADVAAFVSSHRLGDRKKLSYMVLAHSNEIQANVHTHYSKLTPPDYAQLAKRMADDIITYGGTSVITYGSCELKPTEVQRLKKNLKVALLSTDRHSVLRDHVNIKAGLNVDLMNSGETAEKTYSYVSAADEGWLREPGERYAISYSAEHEEIQGIALSRQEIKDRVKEYVETLWAESDIDAKIVDTAIHGSRGRGTAKPESDLDVVIEYHGDMKEDCIFNILNEEPLYIDGVRVDINPIRPEETGTLEQYMERSREYDLRFRLSEPVTKYERRFQDGIDADKANKSSLTDAVNVLYKQGKKVANKIYGQTFFTVTETPKFMKQYGITGEKFTISYGTLARHFGKDASHNLTKQEWAQLPAAIRTPFAITKLKDRNKSYRIYTELRNENDEYVVVGVDVKNAGRDLEVNSIATVFGRRQAANLTLNEDIIYRSKRITLDQSSLLERPNCAPYPTNQGLSNNKGTKNNQFDKIEMGNEILKEKQTELDKLAKQLNISIKFIPASDIHDDDPSMEECIRASMGWSDKKTGEVVVIPDNIESIHDIMWAVFDAVTINKGLRAIVGEKVFNTLCESVYKIMPLHKQKAYLKRYGNRAIAGEEYMATLTLGEYGSRVIMQKGYKDLTLTSDEPTGDTSTWTKITTAVKVALNSVGIQVDFSSEEVRTLLLHSRRHLERSLSGKIKRVPIKVNGVQLDPSSRYQLALGHSVVLDLPDKKTGKDKPVRLSWSEKQGLTGRPSLGGQKHKI